MAGKQLNPVAELRAALSRLGNERARVRNVSPRLFGLEFSECSFPTEDGHTLAGWWLPGRPSGECSGWTAIVHHHYGGQRATTLPWLTVLVRLGFDVLTFDARGHAASTKVTRTSGENFLARAGDVRATVFEAERRKSGRPLLLIGQSQGAAAVALASAGLPQVRALVMDSGPAPELFSASWGLAGALLARREARLAQAALAVLFTAWGKPVRYTAAVWAALARLRGRPLLWIHGTADPVIRHQSAGLWFQALGPKTGAWRKLLVPEAAHAAVVQKAPREVAAAVVALVQSARL